MYLGLILMYPGLPGGWGIIWMLLPSLLFSALTVVTPIKEEEVLLHKFSHQYEEYMQAVCWQVIPGIF